MNDKLLKSMLIPLKLSTLALILEELQDAYTNTAEDLSGEYPTPEVLNEIKVQIELVKWQIETIL